MPWSCLHDATRLGQIGSKRVASRSYLVDGAAEYFLPFRYAIGEEGATKASPLPVDPGLE
jgi:hypothetical protein